MTETNYVGKRLPRYDGKQHVTGMTRYVNDIRLKDTLTVKAWRSPVPSALIKKVDVSKARQLPGVEAVVTHKEVPNNRYGVIGDYPVLADTEIRYLGQEVAAVAAVDEATARKAVELIEVELEEREPILDPFKAMHPDSPKVSPEGNFVYWNGKPYRPVIKGDVDQAFEQADHIIEGYYRTAGQEHSPIETQTGIAQTDSMDRTHIYTTTQAVYLNQGTIASILKKPQSQVHMIGGVVGGGFGSKNDIHTDHICAVLSLYTGGKPVKWVWTREEEMVVSTQRGSMHMFFKDAVMKDGRIIGRQIRSVRDGGAYVLTNDYVVAKHAFAVSGPYNIPNVRVHAYAILTNRRPTSSMRGFGIYQASFGHELQIEKIARELNIDPWRIRFMNAVHDGDLSPTRVELKSCALIESLQLTAKQVDKQLDEDLKTMSSKTAREA
jgi:CO/xanthine dehydrogenase Mo-binding subunit